MIRLTFLLFQTFLLSISCTSQTDLEDKIVGGPCEGCEAVFEYGDKNLKSIDTISGYKINNPKLIVEGTVFQKDGSTPASDIILYFYHTDRNGMYKTNDSSIGWGKRHGIHRTWIKTEKDGKFRILTFRPASYPDRSEPEHIHITVKEPGYSDYYIDAITFMDDPLLTEKKIAALRNRAGSGLTTPTLQDSVLLIRRDIFLGKNIPDY